MLPNLVMLSLPLRLAVQAWSRALEREGKGDRLLAQNRCPTSWCLREEGVVVQQVSHLLAHWCRICSGEFGIKCERETMFFIHRHAGVAWLIDG